MLPTHLYLISLGSNQRHPLIGGPRPILEQALAALECAQIDLFAESPIIISDAVGPSRRRFANCAAIISTRLPPDELLTLLHSVEEHFARIRRGQRWQARTLDLDIILWSGGIWVSEALVIPHVAMRTRNFVLRPSLSIASEWKDPVSGQTLRHLFHRLNRAKPLDRLKNRL